MLALVLILSAFGVVPCIIGGIFLSVYLKSRRRADLMQRVPTSPAATVGAMQPGQLVEVTGALRCPKPLKSEMAGLPCASYVAWIERVYHEDEQDDDGNTETKERSEMLARNVRRVPFLVEDESGRVRVRPDGAEIDGQPVHDRFEARPARGQIWLGGVMVDLRAGGRTLGYRVREEILPIDQPVYVLGAVTDDGGIGRPGKDAQNAGFIISHRSEESVVRSHNNDRWIMWAGAGALAGGGLILVIAAVVGLLFL
jgi:hypothetical protein